MGRILESYRTFLATNSISDEDKEAINELLDIFSNYEKSYCWLLSGVWFICHSNIDMSFERAEELYEMCQRHNPAVISSSENVKRLYTNLITYCSNRYTDISNEEWDKLSIIDNQIFMELNSKFMDDIRHNQYSSFLALALALVKVEEFKRSSGKFNMDYLVSVIDDELSEYSESEIRFTSSFEKDEATGEDSIIFTIDNIEIARVDNQEN